MAKKVAKKASKSDSSKAKPAAKEAKSVKPVKAAAKPAIAAPKTAAKKGAPLVKPEAGLSKKGEKKEVKTPAKAEKNLKIASSKPAEVQVGAVEKPPKASKAEKKAKSEKIHADEPGRWAELYHKYKSEKPQVYNMTAQFEANKPIQHKVLGWGYILSNENDRLEVLFEQGVKMLISNYKTS